jgi:hypothetical protein
VPDPPPAKNVDPTCVPADATSSPELARARAGQMKRLIKATLESDPDMPAYLQRLAEHHFAGGHIAGGCKVVEVAMRVGDADHLATSTQLRMDHCFDGRAQRCTTWYEPAGL